MILSKIDFELNVYKENKLYLFGASSTGLKVKRELEKYGISITAFIDNDESKYGGGVLDGVKILSFLDLRDIKKGGKKYIVQITSTYDADIAKQLKKEKISYISYEEYCIRMQMRSEYIFCRRNPSLRTYIYESVWKDYLAEEELSVREYFAEKLIEEGKDNIINLMVSAPKTGNSTMLRSIEKNKIINAMHALPYVKDYLNAIGPNTKLNIVIGIRDVVSQNLSCLFEFFSDGYFNLTDIMWENDIKTLFDKYILGNAKDSWLYFVRQKIKANYLIQDFFEQYLKVYFDIDIYKYPFDVDKGYSIYDIGNIHIMVYQLEKLNSLECEVGKFLNIDDFTIKKANIASEKWYAEYYKNVCKEIVLEREYFDNCYSGRYMRHFYSEEDITKYKNKWKHIH
jgi:Putative capsular polysaccharide synthesis protein.